MCLLDNLVDSYMNKNYTEFEELCKLSLTLDIESFIYLQGHLENFPDVEYAYELAMQNHPEWGE